MSIATESSPISPDAGEPRVAVIIPNFNGEEYLTTCLTSILDQSYGNYSVTVVDNASADHSVEIVKHDFPGVEVVENSRNTGYAGGCNSGLKRELKTAAKYFVLVNSDVRAGREWLAELVKAAEEDLSIGICQSFILLADDQGLINSAGNESHFLGFGFCGHYREPDRGQFTGVTDVPFASGSSMLVRRELIDAIGLLDEDLFMYQEDLDLSWRARLAGWRVVLAPKSRIFHSYSFSRNSRKFYFLERNRIIVSLKNYSGRSLLVLAPAFLGAELAMLAYSVAGGWFRQKLRAYLYLLRNLDRILEKRRQVQATRRLPDAAVAGYWTDRMGFADLADSPLARIANPVSALYWAIARRLL
ncbi:MAG: glycosyltransferase family 2 protein [Thermoleophilia bacterium]